MQLRWPCVTDRLIDWLICQLTNQSIEVKFKLAMKVENIFQEQKERKYKVQLRNKRKTLIHSYMQTAWPKTGYSLVNLHWKKETQIFHSNVPKFHSLLRDDKGNHSRVVCTTMALPKGTQNRKNNFGCINKLPFCNAVNVAPTTKRPLTGKKRQNKNTDDLQVQVSWQRCYKQHQLGPG